MGVGVRKFSLGFGPKVLGVRRGETEYLLSALPLGGYVKMIGEDPTDESPEAADPQRSFSRKSVGARVAIILAGPVANILLPVLIFWAVFTFVGQTYFQPVIGVPSAGSVAAQAGLQAQDRIEAVNGRPVARWEDVQDATDQSGDQPVTLRVARDGRTFDVRVQPQPRTVRDVFGQEVQTRDLGLHPWIPARIGQVTPGDVADQAGLRTGDRVVALNGAPIEDWDTLATAIHASPDRPVTLKVQRDGKEMQIRVTPRKEPMQRGEGLIGIGPAPETHYRRLNPISALGAGITRTVDMSVMIVQGLVKLIQGRIAADTIGGPILIGQMAGQVAQRGMLELVAFTAMLSINLAILNLLPVPVLDGGHLFFALIEWLRGKPVSLRKREIAQQVGVVLLVALMVFATYNDLFRLFARTVRP
jgi:regulator of sigma E protease